MCFVTGRRTRKKKKEPSASSSSFKKRRTASKKSSMRSCVGMEGKREEQQQQQQQVLRKGPWKAEEDEVLISHVKRYGPRDWSSIRSKGLLQRTGKSCRLRWVNKLRPNLKNGCKFSAEEERVVIELQAQFGNKWARIATHLPGRTDNDVKNFWSSRQKRLARILQASSSKQHKHKREVPVVPHYNVPIVEIPKLSSSAEEESTSRACLGAMPHITDPPLPQRLLTPPPDLPNPVIPNASGHLAPHEFDPNESLYSDPHMQIPFPHIPLPQLGISFSPESQELMARLDEPNYFSLLGPGDDASELVDREGFPPDMPLLGPSLCCKGSDGMIDGNMNVGKPDVFFDDLPLDVTDHFEPLPSPSKW